MNQPKLRLSNPIRPAYTPKAAKYKLTEPATLTSIDVGYPRGTGRHGARKDASLARVRVKRSHVFSGIDYGKPSPDTATLYINGEAVAKFDPATIDAYLDPGETYMGGDVYEGSLDGGAVTTNLSLDSHMDIE